jgi:hypothetical protein
LLWSRWGGAHPPIASQKQKHDFPGRKLDSKPPR